MKEDAADGGYLDKVGQQHSWDSRVLKVVLCYLRHGLEFDKLGSMVGLALLQHRHDVGTLTDLYPETGTEVLQSE